MNTTVLLKKLIAIEEAIGTGTNIAIRDLVHDAQNCVLEMQKEAAQSFLSVAWRDAHLGCDWHRKAS